MSETLIDESQSLSQSFESLNGLLKRIRNRFTLPSGDLRIDRQEELLLKMKPSGEFKSDLPYQILLRRLSAFVPRDKFSAVE
jgi:hypothetical protein